MTVHSSQGLHADPADEPYADVWEHPDAEATKASAEMAVYRSMLVVDGLSMRESILRELSEYHGYPPDECLRRCLHWEDWSVEEWNSADRSTSAGVADFYQSVQSWAFDLMWYAYLQATGHGFPASVLAARFAAEHATGPDHLDFGSGTGTTAQLFTRLGFRSAMADVSEPLLRFAGWRLARHGDHAAQIDLTTSAMPTAAYDVITALDALVHVTDFDATARDLRRAIRTGGHLLANFDVREPDDHGSQWHLQTDAVGLDYRLRAAGFVRTDTLGGVTHCYRAVDPTRPGFRLGMAADRLLLPVRRQRMRARRRVRALARRLTTR